MTLNILGNPIVNFVPLFILVLSLDNRIFMSTVRLWVSGICTRFNIFGFPFPLVIDWKKMVDGPRIFLPFLPCSYLGLRQDQTLSVEIWS